MFTPPRFSRSIRAVILLLGITPSFVATSQGAEPWEELQAQNRLLKDLIQSQQKQLDELRVHVDRLSGNSAGVAATTSGTSSSAAERKLIVSGEVGVAYFAASRNGQYANHEFRIDDANVRFEASVARNTYFVGELQLAKREANDENFHLGEFYLEFENVSGAVGLPDRWVNLRVGRVDIPFGEEYQVRDPLTNPLVTHSLSDIWGTDEGVELYGEMGRSSYAIAVQNGSSKIARDFDSDKAVTVRYGFDVTRQLHLSASVMRTGRLNAAREPYSEVWIGNNVFRNIGSASAAVYQAELGEIDSIYRWSTGRIMAATGRARYRDGDPLGRNNNRRFTYHQIEGTQFLTREFYAAARFSTLSVDRGYPLAGLGQMSRYFMGSLQTKELERLTFGLGYRSARSMVLKFEYTLEDGKLTTGASRNTNMFAVESAIGF